MGDEAPVVGRLNAARYEHDVIDDDLRPSREAVDVTVVVVTHESAGDIETCLSSIAHGARRTTFETIVVDNCSTDGTADLVERRFPAVRLIRKKTRGGFALNANIGAVGAAGRYVLLLNPDTEVTLGAIDALVDVLERDPSVAAVAPRLVYPDGSPQASVRRFPRPATSLVRRTPLRAVLGERASRRHLVADLPDEGLVDVDWVLGAALLVRTVDLKAIGGLDDGFRLYCEDIDLCWRLQDQVGRVVFSGSAVVRHRLAELTLHRFWTVYTWWHVRSMVRYLVRHGLRQPGTVARSASVSSAPSLSIEPEVVGL